jgi:hypothetical protein
MKPDPGPPATLGGIAAAQARIVVWCRACQHQAEPGPAEMARQYAVRLRFSTGAGDWFVSARAVQAGMITGRRPLEGYATCGKSAPHRR